ncbi:unnamed protein product [Brugia timori]|uniref:Uncharacterized protein n=1 Tax=Brugia timori TaxID=42155 RepID=A0A3P7U3C1_9BILA|nr:unnamed protein product [Brugia timori]
MKHQTKCKPCIVVVVVGYVLAYYFQYKQCILIANHLLPHSIEHNVQ